MGSISTRLMPRNVIVIVVVILHCGGGGGGDCCCYCYDPKKVASDIKQSMLISNERALLIGLVAFESMPFYFFVPEL